MEKQCPLMKQIDEEANAEMDRLTNKFSDDKLIFEAEQIVKEK